MAAAELRRITRGVKPAIEEPVEPALEAFVVPMMAMTLLIRLLGAGQRQSVGCPDHPPFHHGMGHFRVELNPERRSVVAKGLVGKPFARGQ
jgi:hypothetical protein